MVKKGKKPICISRDVAMERIDKMIALIESNVRSAIEIECALAAANSLIGENPSKEVYGADCYNRGIKQGLLLTLAMTMARLYDHGNSNRRINKRHVASIPLLVHLLEQKRCRAVLLDRARGWTPHIPEMESSQLACCEKAINDALAVYRTLKSNMAHREAVKRLKDFRDKELAHSLMNKVIEAVPTYNDLFFLTDIARDFVERAILAITGKPHNLKQREAIVLKQAKAFWEPVFGKLQPTDRTPQRLPTSF